MSTAIVSSERVRGQFSRSIISQDHQPASIAAATAPRMATAWPALHAEVAKPEARISALGKYLPPHSSHSGVTAHKTAASNHRIDRQFPEAAPRSAGAT